MNHISCAPGSLSGNPGKRRIFRFPASSLLVGVILCWGCGGTRESVPTGKALSISVSIPPEAFFVERVAGDGAKVSILLPPGQNPHNYEPKPKQIADLSNANVYFTIGVPFEKSFVAKVRQTFPNLPVFDLTEGIKARQATVEDAHGNETDPHTWLSPKNGKIIARNVYNALKGMDPAGEARYAQNLAAIEKDLDRVDRAIAEALKPFAGEEFLVFHPAFGYFGEAYNLKQVSIEFEGKEPGPSTLTRLIDEARSRKIRVIFVQPQFSRRSAEAIAREIAGVVVPMDPLSKDYLNKLEDIARKIGDSIRERGSI